MADPSFLQWWRMYNLSAITGPEVYDMVVALGPVDIRRLLGSIPGADPAAAPDRRPVRGRAYQPLYGQAHPRARLVELPGDDHLPFFGDQDAVVALTQEFFTGALPAVDPDRMLATLFFTDIVDSTRLATGSGIAAGIASWNSTTRWCARTWTGSVAGGQDDRGWVPCHLRWAGCDAECSPERGYYYHPSRHSAGQPIIAGWAFQWICQLSFDRDSWTAPVDAQRLHPLDDTDQTAAGQIRALVGRLDAGARMPLFVFDGGYDSAQLTLNLADVPAAVLVRLRSDRCFYADPPPRPPGSTGRPRRHGAKFNCADPTTWPAPTATLVCQDDQYGTVTVACWAGLHPKQQRHPGHGSRGPRPIVRGTIIRVQAQRVPARTRPPKVLWLWWAGPGEFDLDLVWRAYVRRFDLEHTIRFCKQALGWTTPRPRHPAQADRWTWLVLVAYTQLRLARAVAADARLPWERPRPQPRLSPYRVRRGFPQLLCALGSPASAPKPSGCPPGRPKGRPSGPATRYPAIKKPTNRRQKKAVKHAKAA